MMISLQDVHFKVATDSGEINILRGISLDVAPGESLSIVGPSGSGKSTLMMILGGLERASSGQVQVAGRNLNRLGEDDMAAFRRDHVGIVFQSFHLVPTMTALENVALPLELAGVRDAFERARAELEAVRLGKRLDHFPGQMSGGEQQRVALARAFVMEPHLILADEPTGNLDGETGRLVMDLLFDLHDRKGTGFVLITHDPALAARCSRQVHLEDGLILSDSGKSAR